MVVVMMEDSSYWGWTEELDPIVWVVEYSEYQNQHGQPWKWRTRPEFQVVRASVKTQNTRRREKWETKRYRNKYVYR
jgi:hypothetical protein